MKCKITRLGRNNILKYKIRMEFSYRNITIDLVVRLSSYEMVVINILFTTQGTEWQVYWTMARFWIRCIIFYGVLVYLWALNSGNRCRETDRLGFTIVHLRGWNVIMRRRWSMHLLWNLAMDINRWDLQIQICF